MTIPYRIASIHTNQFAMFLDKYSVGDGITINATFRYEYKPDLSTIRCTTTIQYIQNENVVMVLELGCEFAIQEQGAEAIRQSGQINVEFLRYLATIAVGTARGVIHAKTEGSMLNGLVLPPLNVVETITDSLKIQAKSK